MENKKKLVIFYTFNGIYGETTCSVYVEDAIEVLDYYYNSVRLHDDPVTYNVVIIDCDTEERLIDLNNIKGFPKYLNLDMDKYFKMALLNKTNKLVNVKEIKVDISKIKNINELTKKTISDALSEISSYLPKVGNY